MADDNKDDNTPPEQQLQKVLEARWDPSKLSRFMRSSETSRGHALDFAQRSRFEGRFGVSLGHVRIFTGELAEEITKAHGAEALTVGDTGMILMRSSSAFRPGSAQGTALLAHELTHVAQAMPFAISRKVSEGGEGNATAEELEAEGVEEEELRKELGEEAPKDKLDPANLERMRHERREMVLAKVKELFMDDMIASDLRMGGGHNSGHR